jgi:ferredoxin/uncharacterized protein with FMN-binding domain
MVTVPQNYSWRDRIADLTQRPYRLALWAVLFGLAFVAGRFWFLGLVAVLAIARGIRLRKTGGGMLAGLMGLLCVGLLVLVIYANRQENAVKSFVAQNVPVDLSLVPDGTYEGAGVGTNGDIRLSVSVADGVFENITMLDYREPVYAFDTLISAVLQHTSTDFSGIDEFVFRSRQSIRGFQTAIENALIESMPGYPAPSLLTHVATFFTANKMGRITINAFVILLIAIITFDFFLQPTLAQGTGQTLNCYNCQACVGACPVKMVAGDPFPMIMVIESRAGNYEKVAQLAKYCVGCGKCAAKCPVGASGPSIASSSYLLWKQAIRRDKRREEARLRQWPTLDALSKAQEESDEG